MRRAMIAAALAARLAAAAPAQEAAPPAGQNPPADAALTAERMAKIQAWRAAVEADRQRYQDWLACVRARRFKCDDKNKPDPMAALLNDSTLVEGDIVATPRGLKVFRGPPGTPHRWEDFR